MEDLSSGSCTSQAVVHWLISIVRDSLGEMDSADAFCAACSRMIVASTCRPAFVLFSFADKSVCGYLTGRSPFQPHMASCQPSSSGKMEKNRSQNTLSFPSPREPTATSCIAVLVSSLP